MTVSRVAAKRLPLLLCLPCCALAVAACGSEVSTSSYKAEPQHAIAQRIADLQSNASGDSEQKVCANDLSAELVARLGGKQGCEAAIKTQLGQIDNFEVSVQSIQLGADGSTATARVDSIHEGKTRSYTVALVKEGGEWKVSGS